VRGDLLTLSLLASLAAGVVARGRRGGRSVLSDRETARQVWEAMLHAPVLDLNTVQLKALKRDQFVLPDGSPALAKISMLRWTQDRDVTPKTQWTPTPRGPRFKGYGVEICELSDETPTYLEDMVLSLTPYSRGVKKYFFLPSNTLEDWC